MQEREDYFKTINDTVNSLSLQIPLLLKEKKDMEAQLKSGES